MFVAEIETAVPTTASGEPPTAIVLVVQPNAEDAARVTGPFAATPHLLARPVSNLRDLLHEFIAAAAVAPVRGVVIDMQEARGFARQVEYRASQSALIAARLDLAAVRAEAHPLAQLVLALRACARDPQADPDTVDPLLVVFTSRLGDERAGAMRAGADLWLSSLAAMTEALPAWFDLRLRREARVPTVTPPDGTPIPWRDLALAAASQAPTATAVGSVGTGQASRTPPLTVTLPAPLQEPNPGPEPLRITTATPVQRDSPFFVPDLMTRSAAGRYDARVIASLMGVPMKSLAVALGLGYDALKKTPDRDAAQAALTPVAAVAAMAWHALKDDSADAAPRVRAWFQTPHPALGHLTTRDAIITRRAAGQVRDWLASELSARGA